MWVFIFSSQTTSHILLHFKVAISFLEQTLWNEEGTRGARRKGTNNRNSEEFQSNYF
jgi:hypothetical protein